MRVIQEGDRKRGDQAVQGSCHTSTYLPALCLVPECPSVMRYFLYAQKQAGEHGSVT